MPLQTIALTGLPLFCAGMDIAEQIATATQILNEPLGSQDVLVVAQKIVSKVEGRDVRLGDVSVGALSYSVAEQAKRDPAIVQLILDESQMVLRAMPAAIITRHRTGHVLANSGIDASNVENSAEGSVLLWPEDPDRSARDIRAGLARQLGCPHAEAPAVIVADSMGRAWRMGTVGTAIGCAGINMLDDRRGHKDLFGRTLEATVIGVADSLAAIAVLAMGEGAEGTPAAIIRGGGRWVTPGDGAGAAVGLRPLNEDMFQ